MNEHHTHWNKDATTCSPEATIGHAHTTHDTVGRPGPIIVSMEGARKCARELNHGIFSPYTVAH